jgi:hypothetical protein
MDGTFRFGDRLIIESVALHDVRLGDIVVYRAMNRRGMEDTLVHRVCGIHHGSLITKGDNNPHKDSTPVNGENLIGKVTQVEREGTVISAKRFEANPFQPHFVRRTLSIRRGLFYLTRFFGGDLYRWMRNRGTLTKAWRPDLMKVRVMTEKGPMVKYVHKNRTIARRWSNTGQFICRKPFDLVLWKEWGPPRGKTRLKNRSSSEK